jgi:N-acetylglucosaminyldiphosphoundecaprenol N-acetyl-beta-D-mannosaminyltransferase
LLGVGLLKNMVEILGIKIDNLTIKETLQRVEGFLKDGQQHYIVTPNPEFLVKAQKDEEFRQILNQADLAVPDGTGLIFASRLLGRPLKGRVVGVDLMEKICQRAAQKKWLVFLLGGQEGTAEKAAENLRKRYQGLEIEVGNSRSDLEFKVRPFGYDQSRSYLENASSKENADFQDTTLNAQCQTLNSTRSSLEQRPIVLFVALGAPKQEKWIVQNLKKIPSVKLAIGVGGAFDFISGRVRRAPKFFRLLGLEWLWRLFCQPWRVGRIFNALVKFPWLVLKARFFQFF